MADEATRWQTRPEAGSERGLRFLMWIASHLGRRVMRALLMPVSAYFCLVRGPERRASFNYLGRVFGRPARIIEVLRHFHSFAVVTADRFFLLAGRANNIPVRFVLDDQFAGVLREGRAGVVLAAHFGSFEAARVFGTEMNDIRLRMVLDKSLNERFMHLMTNIEPELHTLIIDSEQGSVALALSISDALKSGDWVGVLADRHRQADRTAEKMFLGQTARFPVGPYIIANLFKAPLIGTFCRLTDKGYEVHCEVLSEQVSFRRDQRQAAIDGLLAKYVSRLEHHVRASPYGWFNFFDFWARPE